MRRLHIERLPHSDDRRIARFLAATHAELVRIDAEIRRATAAHNEFLKELGLPLLP